MLVSTVSAAGEGRALRAALAAEEARLGTPADDADAARAAPADGGLGAYLAVALAHSPEVRAAFERWEAQVHRVARARALPEPTLGFAGFVRAVETRVGPQQARLGVQQAFPWPGRLVAAADAATELSWAAERAFEARGLEVALRVAEAYWTLWELRRTREVHEEHLHVLGDLSATVRARVEVGAATLADLQQVDLTTARLADRVAGMREAELGAAAALRAAVGLADHLATPTTEAPAPPSLPAAPRDELVDAVLAHPALEGVVLRAEAADDAARAAAADRLPGFTVGADWVITGPAVMPDVAESGKDAVSLGIGLRLPLWQGTYAHDVAAARAEAEALRADHRALSDRALAALDRGLAAVRDSARRVEVVRSTLLPQAEGVYGSLLGAYATGRGAVAQTLLAQRDLLELRAELDAARAEHARAWARLEQLCGRELARAPLASPPERSP